MFDTIKFRPFNMLCLFALCCVGCTSSSPSLERIPLKRNVEQSKSEVYETAIFRENAADVTFRVDYYYDGSFGPLYYKGRKQNVAMLGVQPLLQGRKSCGKAKPVVIKEGHHIAYPKLMLEGFAAKGCTSDQLAFYIFTPEKTPITVGLFKFRKNWR